MLKVEGYKMFRGKMLFHSAMGTDMTLEGDFLYKPDTGYWYNKGSSYLDSRCEVLEDYGAEGSAPVVVNE